MPIHSSSLPPSPSSSSSSHENSTKTCPHQLKPFPKHAEFHPSWTFYHIRPWEPRRRKSYLLKDMKRNPWHYLPPPRWQIWAWFITFFVSGVVFPVLPVLTQTSTFSFLMQKVNWPFFTAPGWAWIYSWILASCLSVIAIWFVYLHGGVYSQFGRLLCWFLGKLLLPIAMDVFLSTFDAYHSIWLLSLILAIHLISMLLNITVMKITFFLQIVECALLSYCVAVLFETQAINGRIVNQKKWEQWKATPYA